MSDEGVNSFFRVPQELAIFARAVDGLTSRVEEERLYRRPSSLFKPDVQISRIRLTEGVSSGGPRGTVDRYEALVDPDDDTDARKACDPPMDDSHVDFDDRGELKDV